MIAATTGKKMKFTELKIPIDIQKLIVRNRLPVPEALLLVYLREKGECDESSNDLAARFSVTRRRINQMLEYLEMFGHIEKLPGEKAYDRTIVATKARSK